MKSLKKIFYFTGFDARKILAIRNLPRFIKNYLDWKRKRGNVSSLFPILSDWNDHAGVSGGHYFHQDLIVAQYVISTNRNKHFDVGSRIDGFIAHVASHQLVHIFDIRPLPQSPHKNIVFEQLDIMGDVSRYESSIYSLSCLHAIEHFGLGRYGDLIDPEGHIKALDNMIRMLANGGIFYISFPLDRLNTIEFNAHRTFNPLWILDLDIVKTNLALRRFDYVDGKGNLHVDIECNEEIPFLNYGCGIYTFVKTK